MTDRDAGVAIAAGLREMADHIDGYSFSDGVRLGIVEACQQVIHAVGERPVCAACTDGWVVEDAEEDKVVECSVCFGTGRELPGDVHAVIDREREQAEFWRGRYAALAESGECEGQQHIGEVAS